MAIDKQNKLLQAKKGNDKKRFLRIQQVESRTGYKRATIYKKIKEGSFPKQISLGARAVAWIESEVQDWIEAKIQERAA